jgi:hypothetical protein
MRTLQIAVIGKFCADRNRHALDAGITGNGTPDI